MHCVGSCRQTGALQKCSSGQNALKWLLTTTTPPSSPVISWKKNILSKPLLLVSACSRWGCLPATSEKKRLLFVPGNNIVLISLCWILAVLPCRFFKLRSALPQHERRGNKGSNRHRSQHEPFSICLPFYIEVLQIKLFSERRLRQPTRNKTDRTFLVAFICCHYTSLPQCWSKQNSSDNEWQLASDHCFRTRQQIWNVFPEGVTKTSHLKWGRTVFRARGEATLRRCSTWDWLLVFHIAGEHCPLLGWKSDGDIIKLRGTERDRSKAIVRKGCPWKGFMRCHDAKPVDYLKRTHACFPKLGNMERHGKT